MTYSFLPCGDTAVTVQFKNEISKEVNACVTSLSAIMEKKKIGGVIELIPTFTSVTVCYDCTVIPQAKLIKKIKALIKSIDMSASHTATLYKIPVCYEDEFCPDMERVMQHTGLTREEIIEAHTSRDYLIYMLGFLPGFAYLGGMDERLNTPRLESPRTEIFAGAVGIGGAQTGIYPVASPGGWNLIGKTPVKVYDKKKENPILYRAGDVIRFYAVTRPQFNVYQNELIAGMREVESEEIIL